VALSALRRPLAELRWPGWRHLPRETRDVLFLLGVIGWTVLPHTSHLPLWCSQLAAVVLVWRALLALRGAPLPGRWWLIAVLAVATGLTFISHRTLLGKDAGVTLLVVLMVLKTLELRARRDALVVFFLGFFLVLTHFLYSQSLGVALAMLVSVWGLLTALVLAHMPVGQPGLRQAGTLAARAALFGAPVMVALFLFFPRLGPLWALPQDAAGKTGLSGSLTLGGVAELANDDSIAFRVRFDGPVPTPHLLYWRGPVLSAFDGRDWRRAETQPPAAPDDVRVQGAPLDYEMTLEPMRLPLLPLLEATPEAPDGAPLAEWRVRARGDLEWATDRPITDRLRFHARAWLRFQHGALEPSLERLAELQLPRDYNPRTLAWAAALKREPGLAGADALALSRAVLAHIGRAGYTYTLAPGTYGDERGRHAIDEFWLDRKLGFCEHFATAYVVVMRAMGVPARVVTGYQGADAQLQDGYLIVRQSHAHAWAELWQPGMGWVRMDPTAAVAPERVVRSAQLRPQAGLVAQALGNMSPALLQSLRGALEGLNNRWNQWVLNYSRSQQFDLLEHLGVRSPSWQDLAVLLVGLFSTSALLGAGWALWDRHRRDPWQRLQARVRAQLAPLGIRAQPHEAPRTLAALVRRRLGPRGEMLARQLDALDGLRYGRAAIAKPDAAWWRAFARAAAALPRSG
jgi:transglutaminase-like putative cysteine protease